MGDFTAQLNQLEEYPLLRPGQRPGHVVKTKKEMYL